MNSSIFERYTDRIYKFALSKTFSEDEAEELSQEIILNGLSALPKLRDESCFEPWLWALAVNTAKAFRRKQGRQRAMFVYNAPEMLLKAEIPDDSEEIYSSLREKIAMLSKIYREIIILHYYDGLSVKEISERLGIPAGTVTWRLSEARGKLKKECNSMEETALKPIFMGIEIYGSGNYNGKDRPFPGQLINDALSQNILYNCYEAPKTVEELSKICGVPAYYIEDRTAYLEQRCALLQPAKGKYQTDFLILDDRYSKYCEDNAESFLMPIMKRLVTAFETLCSETGAIGHYRADKSEDELKFLYGAMAFDFLSRKYCPLEYPKIPENFDGNRWRYIGKMDTGKYHRTGIGFQINRNNRSGNTYGHWSLCFRGFAFRSMMCDEYIAVCEELLTKGVTEREENAANAIRDGYIRRENGKLFVGTPAFTKEQNGSSTKLPTGFSLRLCPNTVKL